MTYGRSPYPKYFKTPEGRAISIKTLAKALRTIRKNPDAEYPGWNWFPTPGRLILRSVMDGVHDRINQRGARHCPPMPGTRLRGTAEVVG